MRFVFVDAENTLFPIDLMCEVVAKKFNFLSAPWRRTHLLGARRPRRAPKSGFLTTCPRSGARAPSNRALPADLAGRPPRVAKTFKRPLPSMAPHLPSSFFLSLNVM